MNNEELKSKVRFAAYNILKTKAFVSPVDILLAVGVLAITDYENWRMGRVDYLERVCKVNLSMLSLIIKELRYYSQNNGLEPSWTAYRKWGKGKKFPLRFSKSGDAKIEEMYATHFVSSEKQKIL